MINESRGSVDISYTLLKLSLFSKSIHRVYIYIYILKIGEALFYYKLGQTLLQIGA